MEDNKELATEVAENVEEQATEELVDGAKSQTTDTEEVVDAGVDTTSEPTEPVEEKIYTKKQYQDKLTDNAKRMERRLRSEYEKKYGYLTSVLKAGTGIEDDNQLADAFADFYTKKGKNVPQRNNYINKYDMEAGAEKEANDIISSSFDEVVSEVDRLSDKGLDNMDEREKILFQRLATYRQNKERENELLSIGVNKDVLESTEFNNFASQFNSNVPIKNVYDMWIKTQPKPKVEQIGSMQNTNSKTIKDYYTPEEARRLTNEDYDKNPELEGIIEKSMKIWYEKGI